MRRTDKSQIYLSITLIDRERTGCAQRKYQLEITHSNDYLQSKQDVSTRETYAQAPPKRSPMASRYNKRGHNYLNFEKFPEKGSFIIG